MINLTERFHQSITLKAKEAYESGKDIQELFNEHWIELVEEPEWTKRVYRIKPEENRNGVSKQNSNSTG